MIRALFDANVIVSGLAGMPRPEVSVPGALMHRWEAKDFQLIVSVEIMSEVIEAIRKPYFQRRMTAADYGQILARLRRNATYTELTLLVQGAAPDPDDDHVLAAAASADVDYLVTGDRALHGLGSYGNVRLVSPREFLEILEST